ncbi:terminase [Paraburkholderia caribensis]|uniref:terminase n=1 Tax=Paraburkholderia caribensis TaxID=75105 RepID=UPI000D15E836|nr:terminase [Paraburkholderia caribensis]PTB28853.1 terminase [Paraburkholderia caribensis]
MGDPRLKLNEWSNPVWRLHNLYWITDKSNRVVKFKPNLEQTQFLEELHYRNVILKARQLGFSTLIQLMFLDQAVFTSNIRAGVIADTKPNAEIIFRDKIRFAYDRLPNGIREKRFPETDSTTELLLSNNSSVRVGTSMRSGTLQYLHISEFGKICAKDPKRAREIVTGAIPALAPDGFLFVESTAEGRDGPFFEMCEDSRKRSGAKHKPLEEKFHFFPWFVRDEYETDPTDVVISVKEHEYFEKIEKSTGAKITPRKRAWYVITKRRLGADMKREYPSTADEAFESSNEGAWYREQFDAIRTDGRICRVPYERSVLVNTFWDIGANDLNSIWFHQLVGPEHRFLKYYESSGRTLDHYVQIMKDTGYAFGTAYLPHDAGHKRLGTGFKNRSVEEMLNDLDVTNTIIVPRIDDVTVGINQTRMALSSAYFDAEGCKEGLDHVEKYSKEWDERAGTWKDYPKHDIHSNAADALRQWGQKFKNLRGEEEDDEPVVIPATVNHWNASRR